MVSRFACSRLPGEKLLAAAPAAGRYLTKQLRKIERPFGDFVIPTNRQDLLNEIARACTCLMNGLQIRMLAASRREALGQQLWRAITGTIVLLRSCAMPPASVPSASRR